ncbi:MAG: hypothetical protein LIR40_14710 [Bacteroidota bacterium]|nr:hypothetical protein [Bacteroidota bacterium]
MMIVLAISLYSSRIVLQNLGVEDFGIYNLVGGVIVLVSFMSNTLRDGVQRFYSFYIGKNDQETLNKIYYNSINLHIIASLLLVVVSLIGYWFIPKYLVLPSGKITDSLIVYSFSVISLIATLLSIPYIAMVVARERFNFIAILGVIEAVAKLCVAFSISLFTNRLILYSLLLFLVSLLSSLSYVLYVRLSIPSLKYFAKTDLNILRRLCSFSGWNMFGSFSNLFISYGTNIILGMFFTPAVCAARGISFQVMGAVRQFSTNFQTVINPQIIKEYASGNTTKFYTLIFKGCRLCFLLFGFISMPLCFFVDEILRLWLGSVPEHTATFVILVLILASIESIGYPLTTAVRATEKIKKFMLTTSVIITLSVPVSWLLLRFGMSPESVFLNNILFTSLALVIRFIIVKNLIDYSYNLLFQFIFKSAITIILQVAALFCIVLLLSKTVISFIISYIACGFIFFFIGMSPDERAMIIKLIFGNIYKSKNE